MKMIKKENGENALLKISLFFIIVSISFNIFAQEVLNIESMKKKKEQLLYDFKKFEKLDDNNLSEIIENLNKRTSSYIIKRRVECEGDFSSLEIDEQGEKVILKKKLSEIEKKLCMLELINFQRKFTNVVFELRKKVISKNYNNNLNTLEQLKQNQIEELEKIANKYK